MRSGQPGLNQEPLLVRLAHDRAGNTLLMIAAAILPIMAMVGGGIDMGRSYLSQSRLQQACDAGVLAARKKLGSQIAVTGTVPADVEDVGNRFFNVNFQDGSYGTADRDFAMTLENDYAISGVATVDVPTTIMQIFGFNDVPVRVECEARLNFSNTDVMMVLDTTGSMRDTNPDDTSPKIDVLRSVVKNFHAQIEGSKTPGTRIRYGFLPYSTNVNVGFLLKSDWLVDQWSYQGRNATPKGTTSTRPTYTTKYTYISGSVTPIAPYTAKSCPADTRKWKILAYNKAADGTETWTVDEHGQYYECSYADGATVTVNGTNYDHHVYTWSSKQTGTETYQEYLWHYQPMKFDVSFIKGASGDDTPVGGKLTVPMGGWPEEPSNIDAWFKGCVEERDTTEIKDYDNVDIADNLDLDIDLVPDPARPETQWRPMFNDISFLRAIKWNGSGSFSKAPVTTGDDYANAGFAGLSACPASASKLAEMSAQDVADYVDTLSPEGSTYHDIGMIWGGRLLSPTGIFADENADEGPGKPTSRHMIFLTDGLTAPLDLSYGTYGIEPLDQRRWKGGSSPSLTQVVEQRFSVACAEVKKRNITVWVVGFGTTLNPALTECAGQGHYFEAGDADQLNAVFSKIAAALGDLRITR